MAISAISTSISCSSISSHTTKTTSFPNRKLKQSTVSVLSNSLIDSSSYAGISARMACMSSSSFLLPSDLFRPRIEKPASLSWSSSLPQLNLSLNSSTNLSDYKLKQGFVVQAAWTRRSRGEAAKRPSRKSWKQRTDMYLKPFLLNVFFSNKFIHAKVMHRGTSKVISVATTNAKDLRTTLPSLTDNNACRVIGKLIAERSKEADIYCVTFEAKKGERIEGKLGLVLDTIKDSGIIFV